MSDEKDIPTIGTAGEGTFEVDILATDINDRVPRMLEQFAAVEDHLGTEETMKIAIANLYAASSFIMGCLNTAGAVLDLIDRLRSSAAKAIEARRMSERATHDAPEARQ